MKIAPSFLLLLVCTVLTANHCKKNKPTNPVDQLPPETQTGANTFGCLVNGQVFKPGGAQLIGGSLQCNYQYVNNGFYFTLIGRNKAGSNLLSSIGLYTDSLMIQQGDIISLKARIKGNSSGNYYKAINSFQYEQYDTDGNIYKGILQIKKLDPVNQIVSGTFWFDAMDSNGKKVEVREGRFDTHYTL